MVPFNVTVALKLERVNFFVFYPIVSIILTKFTVFAVDYCTFFHISY